MKRNSPAAGGETPRRTSRIVKPLPAALGAMLAQQSFASMTKTVVPVVAPAMTLALALDPALVGVFTSLMSVGAVFAMLGCGGFIQRYGGLRVSQASLFIVACGVAGTTIGVVPVLALTAAVIGIGVALATPASSQVLTPHAPPRWAPLIFSLKQTGVPIGGMMAGLIAPYFERHYGWEVALLVIAGMCVVLGVALQPLRPTLDAGRTPDARLSPADITSMIRGILATPALRAMGLVALTFVGLQSIFASFYVTYLTVGLGYSLTTSGSALSIALSVSVGARVLWGWIGSRFISPRLMIAFLGIAMGIATIVLGLSSREWGLPALVVVGIAISVTAGSWHGVMLAEVARLAPPGKVGGVTGGVLACGSVGEIILPLVFSGLLATTGSYALGFLTAATPAFVVGLLMLRPLRGDNVEATPK